MCACICGCACRRCEELLPGEAARASELLEAWRTSSACEAKLGRALRDGCNAASLSRTITEAAAAGVKVTSAKRMLKLQQFLEAAVAAASEAAASAAASAAAHSQLVAKLEAAEAGGVAPSVLLPARQLLRKLLAVEARQALEAALKPHSDWSANMRISTLRAALDKAEEALGCSMQELEEQQQQRDRQAGGTAPQQDQQQEKDAPREAAAAAAGDAADQSKQQRRAAASVASVTSTAASTGSKGQAAPQPLSRADSISSEACSEASSLAPSSTAGGTGSTAGDVQQGSRPCECAGVDPEVQSALQELSLRAWQLLLQDQQQLEERERERLEQERARREVCGTLLCLCIQLHAQQCRQQQV